MDVGQHVKLLAYTMATVITNNTKIMIVCNVSDALPNIAKESPRFAHLDRSV